MDAVKAAVALTLLGGCALDMSPAQPWVPIDEAPLAVELVQPDAALVSHRLPAVASRPLRIVTYNVEYGPDMIAVAAAIETVPVLARAGVFLIQEIEDHDGEACSRAQELADRLGYGYVYVPARTLADGTHGLAIVSAFPIRNVERMDLRESSHPSQHRIAIRATLDVDGTPVSIIDVHLDTFLNAQQRIAQLSPVVVDAADIAIVAGDFNASSVQWVDGSVPVLSASSASDQAPVVDSYMEAQDFDAPTRGSGPTEHMYGLEQRLDMIYTRGLSPDFGGVERVGPSDHWPMWIDVAM
jgi:endonuclease/exonuclease/phosphatase family metal-dependent hydrolase